jgi:glycosyltransferase involved in cell wall biosynthesis
MEKMNEINPSSMPLVSVCIPTYNRADKLQRAVETLLNGTYSNLEIIISDNASSDHTQEVCAKLCNRSSSVRYFRHSFNQGPTKNFEFARCQARGQYFLWHGDDDHLEGDYIKACVAELEDDSSLILVSGVAAYHRGNREITHYGKITRPRSSIPLLRALTYLLHVEDNAVFCGLYRLKAVSECNPPDVLAGDWAWVADVLLRGRVQVLPAVHVYREFGDSASSSVHRIVSMIHAPAWHAEFPWLAIALNMADFLARKSTVYASSSLLKRLSVYLLVLGVIFIKMVISFAHVWIGKIPYAKKIYFYLTK